MKSGRILHGIVTRGKRMRVIQHSYPYSYRIRAQSQSETLNRNDNQRKLGNRLRDLELRLISSLMKNSRRSDRELARSLGTSQPTVTRLRTKLEKEGYVQEYTMLPNLMKIGFEIMAFTYYKLKKALSSEENEEAKENIMESARENPTAVIIAMAGIGAIDADRVIVSFHKSYSDYAEFLKGVRQVPHVLVADSMCFLGDL